MIDLLIRNEGTVVTMTPVTPAARQWIDENVMHEGWQWLGDTLVIDHRCAEGVIQGAMLDGLGVACE